MRDPDGTSKGCAFIRFKNKEDALLAMRFLNGNVYLAGSDKPIEVRFAENKKKTGSSTPTETTAKHHTPMSSSPAMPVSSMGGMSQVPVRISNYIENSIPVFSMMFFASLIFFNFTIHFLYYNRAFLITNILLLI